MTAAPPRRVGRFAVIVAGVLVVAACAPPAPAAPPAPQFPPPPDPVTVCVGQLGYWAGEQLRGAPDQGFDYQHMGLTSQQADALAQIVERARAEGAGVITPMAARRASASAPARPRPRGAREPELVEEELPVITVSVADRVGVIELARPERRNALDVEHCRDLAAAVGEVLAAGVGAIVVTGAGTSFCSGADLDEVCSDGFREALRSALDAIVAAPVPVVAAVNGPAIGAGTQLAIACDLRVVAPEAVFAVPTARLGLAVDPWTVERIAQLAGGATVRALLLACDRIGAELALARGLADRIGDRDAALALAAEIAGFAPLTLRYNKMAADRTAARGADPELLAAFEACWASADLDEGRTARTERRPPVFTGR